MIRRALPALLALAVLAAGLAACGGEADAGGAVASVAEEASAASGADGEAETETRTGSADPDEAGLAFARCMREHGIDMEDPKPGGPLKLFGRKGDEGKLEEAQKACRKHLDGAVRNASPEDRERARQASLDFARCMREHGVDMPDPTGDGGIRIGPENGVDPEAPTFQKAQRACEGIIRAAFGDEAGDGRAPAAPSAEKRGSGE